MWPPVASVDSPTTPQPQESGACQDGDSPGPHAGKVTPGRSGDSHLQFQVGKLRTRSSSQLMYVLHSGLCPGTPPREAVLGHFIQKNWSPSSYSGV